MNQKAHDTRFNLKRARRDIFFGQPNCGEAISISDLSPNDWGERQQMVGQILLNSVPTFDLPKLLFREWLKIGRLLSSYRSLRWRHHLLRLQRFEELKVDTVDLFPQAINPRIFARFYIL